MVRRENLPEAKGLNEIFENIFKNNHDAIIVTDRRLDLVYKNQAAYKVTPPELQKGVNIFVAFPEIHFFDDELKKVEDGNAQSLSINRDIYTLEISVSPLNFYENLYFLLIIRSNPVSLRKTGESYFKSLIQQSPIATAIFQPSGKPVYFNRAYSELFSIRKQYGEEISKKYNLLKDEQVLEAGILPFIERCLAGETVEIPVIAYNPVKTAVLKPFASDKAKYVKGSLYPIKDVHDIVKELVLVLIDVTLQKKAEQILTESHLKSQMLNRNLPGAIYEYEQLDDDKGKFIYISQRSREIFGYDPEEIMNDESIIYKMIYPEDRNSYNRSLEALNGQNNQWEWEGRINVKGQLKWIEARSTQRVQLDGRKISYGLFIDITEKKIVEEQFKIAEKRLHLALQSADISLWEWQEHLGKVYLNQNWCNKFGYTCEETSSLFSDWREMIHPEDLEEVEERLNKVISGEADFFEAEYRLKCKNDHWSWILDKGRAVEKDPEGKVLKVAGTHVEINDRKHSESIIKKNEQLFMQLFENSPLGIVLLDENNQVVLINKGFEDLFGFSKHEILFTNIDDFIVPDAFIKEALEVKKLAEEGQVVRRESFRRRKSGDSVPVILYGVPVIFNDKTIATYGIYVDISDRKNAEHELQVRNNELDNFVYKVSHDLRAPLASILGLVNLAGNEQNDDDLKIYIDLIGKRVRQLDTFIRDVLSHSKNLKQDIFIDKIDFNKIIEQCRQDLNYLPGAEKINYQIDISGKDFYSDHWRISEILRNLLSNAIKYMNPRVERPYISIKAECSAEKFKMIFSDNGLGIEKQLQSRIFDMFFRATVYAEGSGIGLYIVKNAVQKLSGTIGVMSELQKGTTFAIEIPNRKRK